MGIDLFTKGSEIHAQAKAIIHGVTLSIGLLPTPAFLTQILMPVASPASSMIPDQLGVQNQRLPPTLPSSPLCVGSIISSYPMGRAKS